MKVVPAFATLRPNPRFPSGRQFRPTEGDQFPSSPVPIVMEVSLVHTIGNDVDQFYAMLQVGMDISLALD
jgi:hypothetical protein